MIQTTYPISLQSGGVGVYMEFNYMSNIPVNIAIQGTANSTNGNQATAITSCGGVYPSAAWNKTYIDLTEQVSTLKSGLYTIYITTLYNDLVGADNYAYIDNIKIVQAQ